MKQRHWDIYHRAERKQKRDFLKRLSEKQSLAILRDLYRFAYNLAGKSKFDILHRDKIETLVRIHSIFGKVG